MADVTLNIRHNASQAAPAVGQLANEMGRMATQSKSAATAGTAAANGFKKIGNACLSVGKSASNGASGISKFVSSLGRIAYYRAIRTAIKYVGQAFNEGLKAAYAFSKASQPADYAKLAGAMDSLKASAKTMSLQLGAAFGGLLTAITPVLIQIINLVTAAADAITRFFAVLNGSGYYKKAASGFEEVGASAGGAGKKIKGLLASWDELNVIGKESGGGGGGSSATDYSGAYEWVEAESDWANLFQTGDFFGIGAKIGEALGNILGKFDEWLQKVRELHLGTKLAEIINGFFSDQNLFKNAGETLADTLIVVVEAVGDFLENVNWEYIKNAFVTFAKSFFSRINDELSKPENFGEGPDFKPYWELLDELWRKDPNNVNPDGSSKKWYDGILEDLERMWEDTKRSFEEAGDMISATWDSWIQSIKDKFNLAVAWVKDLPTKAKNAGIKIINALAEPIISGINSIIEKYNDSFLATLLGEIDPISFELIPEIPPEELTRNYDNAKKLIEARNATDAIKLKFQAQVEKKVEFKELFENFFKPSSNKAEVEVDPEVKEPVGTSKIFGENSGVTSGGGKTNLTLGVLPSLGPVKPFYDDMDYKITGKTSSPWQALVDPRLNNGKQFVKEMEYKITGATSWPWQALVDPKYNSGAEFTSIMKKRITGETSFPWQALVDPRYNSGVAFTNDMNKKITGETSWPWQALVDPKYNSDSAYRDKMSEKVTGVTNYTKVNPELSVPQKYKDAMGDLTDAKTVNITPKLTDAEAFKEQLQSALKASASIKSDVSGTTKTIGKVSMSEYAQGGWPNIGDLFIANEAGPELVGTIGGSTAVANNDDIVQGIQGGVERANAEQNELLRQQNSILAKLLNKELTINPSVALGQVMARSAALYGRA